MTEPESAAVSKDAAKDAAAVADDAALPFASMPAGGARNRDQQQQQQQQHSPNQDGHNRSSSGRFRFSFRKKSQKAAKKEAEDLTQKCTFLTRQQAAQVESELLTEYALSLDQLLEHCGLSAAVAFARIYPRESLARDGALLVCCGPGNNGGFGLVCARYLKLFGYKLTVFYPKTPAKAAYRTLLNQCEKMDIPFLSYMPGDVQVLDHSYCLIVDALFGHTFQAPVRPDLADVLQKLTETAVPVVSIDVPSGWEADKAPTSSSGSQHYLRPDTLISLLLPKRCSLEFGGRRHYLAGRLLPATLATKLELRLPAWPPQDVVIALVDCPDGVAHSGSANQLTAGTEASAGGATALTAAATSAAATGANSTVSTADSKKTQAAEKSDKSAINCF